MRNLNPPRETAPLHCKNIGDLFHRIDIVDFADIAMM